MPITFDEQKRAWLIETAHTAYAFGVDAEGRVLHYWHGTRLPYPADYPGFGTQPNPFDYDGNIAAHEYAGWGGLNYTEPSLKVTFADGVRDLVLRYKSHDLLDGAGALTEMRVTLADAVYGLEVVLGYRAAEECDIIERWATIRNTGDSPITIEQVMSAVLHLPASGAGHYRLTHLAGEWGAEFQVNEIALTDGKKTIESRSGHTSSYASPFFALDYCAPGGVGADEEQGQVWFGALGWSGNWIITAEQLLTRGQRIAQIVAGINSFDFRWHLAPGEEFQTPVLSFGYSDAGFGQASRNLHLYQRRHILPPAFATKPRPILYNSWEPIMFNVGEESQIELAERAAQLGVELFVVDDGWFGTRDSDHAGLGDWWVSPTKLPNGLTPIIERVNTLGMQFGLWIEPEMVNPDSDLYRAHPDWVYHFPNRARSESRNQLVLNLSRDDVQEYLLAALNKLLSENNIAFIKWDYNRYVSEPGWPDAPSERQQEMWVRSVYGFYRLLDRLRAAHPSVSWESCSSGGGRVDLGVLRRADQTWASDNTDPYDRLFIQEGYSMAYPARTMFCWAVDSPHWEHGRTTSVAYRFHSSMMGGLGLGGFIAHWSDADMAEARRLVEQYKTIRHLVQDGLLYRLASPRHSTQTAVQYVREDRQEAIVFVLSHLPRHGTPHARIRLRGLQPDLLYRVEQERSASLTVSGAALMAHGLDFNHLRGDYASTVVRVIVA